MGNTWDFRVYRFTGPDNLRADVISALGVAQGLGYSVRFPTEVMMSDGWTEISVQNRELLLQLLTNRGGLVTLWGPLDADIVFSVNVDDDILSFGALRSLVPERDAAGAKIAADLERMFLDTCLQVTAWYGFSSDEWGLEARFVAAEDLLDALSRHERAVRAGQPPHLVFWLNYFSSAYWAKLDVSLFADVAQIDNFGSSGVVLRTQRRPPNVEVIALTHDTRYE